MCEIEHNIYLVDLCEKYSKVDIGSGDTKSGLYKKQQNRIRYSV